MLTDAQRLSMAIQAALAAGDLDALRACFDGNAAFPNVQDPLTATDLLALAIYRSPLATVQALLDMGADPALKTRIDEYATPLDEAELMGNAEGAAMLKRLLDR